MKIVILLVLLASWGGLLPHEGQEKTYIGRAIVYEFDFELARAEGWMDSELSEQAARELVAARLRSRLVRTGKFVEAQVRLEEGGRISVTFVGDMSPGYLDFLRDGLGHSGRLEFQLVAVDEDLEGTGTDLEHERERLATWLALNQNRHLGEFRGVPRAEGGPHPGIEWRLRRRLPVRGGRGVKEGDDDSVEAPDSPVEKAPDDLERAIALLVPPADEHFDVTAFERVSPRRGDDRRPLLGFTFREAEGEAFHAFTAAHVGRELAVVNEHEVVASPRIVEPLGASGVIDGAFDMTELRALVLALDGKPMPTRLRFVEFSTRELTNVARRSDPDQEE